MGILHPSTISTSTPTSSSFPLPPTTQVLRPKISLLKKEAGLADPTKLGAVLSAQPRALLTSSLDRHLKPTVAFFTTKADDASGGLGMRRSTLARIAAKRPILLTYDVGQLLHKAEFFGGLGLTAPQIRRMVAASPDVLSIGIGNDLQPTVVRSFFLSFFLSFLLSFVLSDWFDSGDGFFKKKRKNRSLERVFENGEGTRGRRERKTRSRKKEEKNPR